MKIKLLIAIYAVALMSQVVPAQSADKVMKGIFKDIDQEFGRYKFYGYPITNFGVLSVSSSSNDRFDDKRKLCSTFKCLNQAVPTDALPKRLIDTKYVEIGHGGPIAFKSEKDRQFLLNAALPSIKALLGIDFKIDNKSNVKANLTFARAYKRSMNKADFMQYVYSLRDSQDATQKAIYRLLLQNRLCLVIADVTVDEMDVEIVLDSSSLTDLGVKFDGKVAETLGKEGQVGVKVSKANDYTFKLTIREPMVVAIYPLNVRNMKFPLGQ